MGRYDFSDYEVQLSESGRKDFFCGKEKGYIEFTTKTIRTAIDVAADGVVMPSKLPPGAQNIKIVAAPNSNLEWWLVDAFSIKISIIGKTAEPIEATHLGDGVFTSGYIPDELL